MKVYRLETDSLHLSFDSVEDFDFNFDGKPMLDSYRPIAVEAAGDGVELGDFPYFPDAPVFSQKALDLLKDLIGPYVEILPLNYKEGIFYLINVINVLDSIDYSKSNFERFPDDNRIMLFYDYAFKKEQLKEQVIFKSVDEIEVSVFVTDYFVEIVKKTDLKGYYFQLLWDSEGIEEPEKDFLF